MKDYRLYYYIDGTLRKFSNLKGQYRFSNLVDIDKFIETKKESKHLKDTQWVVVEYFGNFESKIIKVY